ncbi:MAG: hypothetical protein LC789_11625 [Actinobacteria bacterium]|nr:hypothetical protein [Actinomycetota bacterium]
MPDEEAPAPGPGQQGVGKADDWDRPFDAARAWAGRFNGGTGHGTLGDKRVGFMRLR